MASAAWLGDPGRALATEGETDLGVTAGITFLDARSKGVHVGAGGTLMARHGITDAFDLVAQLSLSVHPSLDTNLYGAAAGAHYIVDVGRFRPHLGLLLGATDVSTATCPRRPSNLPDVTDTRPPVFPCGDEILPTGTVPFGVDWSPDTPIRVGFAASSSLLLFRDDVPDLLLHIQIGAGFTWIFDADEASR